VVVLHENGTLSRQIFLDGRPHPINPQPAWLGYSVGRWEGDALVVETVGFNDQTWLDGTGHPHSDRMRLTERFVRRTVGRMDLEITIDDPAPTRGRSATCSRKYCCLRASLLNTCAART
jgi:hypothetical protein